MQVNIQGLSKSFASVDGNVPALRDVNFTINPGEFYTLLGPSGCGKSTTLRCVAGLERPDTGNISIGEQAVVGKGIMVPANERPIGMVFQSYAIWPHMTVFNNVVFPLKQRRSRLPKAEREKRVMEALELVQMAELAHRPAPYLSGGQQQRVALARALVSRPHVLLLDEPLSNLDAKLREELRIEIKDLTKRLGITALYVTHDQLEALAMSDRIAVMSKGKILQESTPRELYFKPQSNFVAQFIGQVNFFEGSVIQKAEQGIGTIETSLGKFRCPVPANMTSGSRATLAIRPESLHASDEPGSGRNRFEGILEKAIFSGDSVDCQVKAGDRSVHAKVSSETFDAETGGRVCLEFDATSCMVLAAEADKILND